MKFLHIADLHLGKTIYGVPMLEDQEYWMKQFLQLAKDEDVDAVVVAGDVYDRAAPSGEAMQLLDYFITQMSQMNIPLLMIAGNHDSGLRLSYGEKILAEKGVHIAGKIQAPIKSVTITGKDGVTVDFWLLPYVYPFGAASALQNKDIHDYGLGIKKLLEASPIDFARNNVIVSHQNVTANGENGLRGGSESMVGGVGNVDYHLYDGFEYAALGHIHAGYAVGRKEVRYVGTPLCYHFDELKYPDKGAVLVDIGPKGSELKLTKVTIDPLHPLKEYKDTYENLKEMLPKENLKNARVKLLVTDERMSNIITEYLHKLVEDGEGQLLECRSGLLYADLNVEAMASLNSENKSLKDLFVEFYHLKSDNNDPSEDEMQCISKVQALIETGNEASEDDLADSLLKFVKRMEE